MWKYKALCGNIQFTVLRLFHRKEPDDGKGLEREGVRTWCLAS